MEVTAVIPLKGFTVAKERLAPGLSAQRRALLAAATAQRVITACLDAQMPTIVVTGDPAVVELATRLGASGIADPGSGLDAAAAAGVATVDSWVVVHGDLPLLSADALTRVVAARSRGHWAIAPARDGGTNLIAGSGVFGFAYGPASFHRHLARIAPKPIEIVVSAATAVEIDTPDDLEAAASLPGGEWLRAYLS
jgi:2-phospho-L-lactate guanylyltransferase